MTTDFGSDVSTFPRLDPMFALISGTRAVAEAVARRLMTPRGSLFWDPDAGFELRGLVGEALDTRSLYALRVGVERECEKDERVDSVVVTVEFSLSTQLLSIRVVGSCADGSFQLVLAASSLSVEVLKAA